MSKLTVTHFLNTRVQPKEGRRFPIYIRITYLRVTHTISSSFTKNTFLTETEFSSISTSVVKLPKTLELVKAEMGKEQRIIKDIFDFCEQRNLGFAANKILAYLNLLNTPINLVINKTYNKILRRTLIDFMSEKLNFSKESLSHILVDEISSIYNSEIIYTDDITRKEISLTSSLINWYSSFEQMYKSYPSYKGEVYSPFTLAHYFFNNIDKAFDNYINLTYAIKIESTKQEELRSYYESPLESNNDIDLLSNHLGKILISYLTNKIRLINSNM